MNQKLWLFIMLFFAVSAFGQKSGLKGVVIDFSTGEPVSGVSVHLKNQNRSTVTANDGTFRFENLPAGLETISIISPAYIPYERNEMLLKGRLTSLGKIALVGANKKNQEKKLIAQQKEQDEDRQDILAVFDEIQLDDESDMQGASYLSGASDDVYLRKAGFSFSPMRFRVRGYNQDQESTYINGVNFNDLERGRFNYSMLGGLNDAMRNKDAYSPLAPSNFAFGNVGGITNIDTRASSYAAGTKASVAYTNRAYKLRAQATYATGLMPNGWAFTGSAVYRWSDEGIVDGTFYNSVGYFLSAEKVFNPNHSISFTTFGAPTERAQQGAVTQEVYDLAGSIYYNPYWGYQDGRKRNSRIVNSFDPTAVFNYDWKINQKQRWQTGVGFHYSFYSNTALNFYNAEDPRPDYYRNLPSYLYTQMNDQTSPDYVNQDVIEELNGFWKNKNTDVTQVNWDRMYQTNYKNNVNEPNANTPYILEQRHNDLMEAMLNSTYNNQINKKLKLTAGIEAKYSVGKHYKTMYDFLGGTKWLDIDQFAERDFKGGAIIQNDQRNPNKEIKEGDVFGYDYNMNIFKVGGFAQNEWKFRKFDLFYAARVTYTQFNREGFMQNGRAPQNSYGTSKTVYFVDPSVKAGVTYKINGRQWLTANILAETRAPFAYNSYISPRIKDNLVKGLKQEKVLSYDLSYNISTPVVRGRLTLFQTHMQDGMRSLGFYHDEYRTFVNHTLYDLDKLNQGIELGVTVKISNSFSVTAVGTFADYHYTNNAKGVMSAESGIDLNTGVLPIAPNQKTDVEDEVLTKDLKISNGPQAVGSFTVNYFHPKLWFADVTLNYYDNNYLDFAPNRFSAMNMKAYTPEQKKVLGTQEKLKGGFMLDASLGKLIYFKGRSQSLNLNLSLSNILNNTKMVTGGYQQARISRKNNSIDNMYEFPPKYYYAWGFNLFLNVGYKF